MVLTIKQDWLLMTISQRLNLISYTMKFFFMCLRILLYIAEGHLEILKRVYPQNEKSVFFRAGEPDFSVIPNYEYDWENTVHIVHEEIPTDVPKPLGPREVLTHYVDVYLFHYIISGRSIVNKTTN